MHNLFDSMFTSVFFGCMWSLDRATVGEALSPACGPPKPAGEWCYPRSTIFCMQTRKNIEDNKYIE